MSLPQWGNHLLELGAWKVIITATLKCICNDSFTEWCTVLRVVSCIVVVRETGQLHLLGSLYLPIPTSQLQTNVKTMQGWGFANLTSLLYPPYLVCILFGMPSLHPFTFKCFVSLVSNRVSAIQGFLMYWSLWKNDENCLLYCVEGCLLSDSTEVLNAHMAATCSYFPICESLYFQHETKCSK